LNPEASSIVILIAEAIVVMAALLIYMSAKHQKLVISTLPRKALAMAGTALVIITLIMLMSFAGSATSVFILLSFLMAFFTLFPPLVAFLKTAKEGK